MVSTALFLGKDIDLRVMNIRGTYCKCNAKQAYEISKYFYGITQEYLENTYITKWKLDGKSIRDFDKEQYAKVEKYKSYDLSFEAEVKSELVYNKGSMNRYFQNMSLQAVKYGYKSGPKVSSMYEKFYKEYLKNSQSGELKANLTKLFNINKFPCIGTYLSRDAQGFLMNTKSTDGSFYGEFSIQLSIFSLENSVDIVANYFRTMLFTLEQLDINLNASIGIIPVSTESPYMMYFGYRMPREYDYITREWGWAQNRLLCDTQWLNIVSKYTREYADLLPNENTDYILTEEMNCGSLCVQLKKTILETDINDLALIKQYLYPVLLPGESIYNVSAFQKDIRFCPRINMENMPVLEKEIIVTGDVVQFKIQNKVDWKKIEKIDWM